MAVSRIKGITIEIGGDTTKLQTALKGVNTEIRSTQRELKDVEKLLKLDPGNTELLAQKMADTMNDNMEGQLTILKLALEELAISFGQLLISALKAMVKWLQGFL